MPLLVVGDLSVTIPQDILPEWNPPVPYKRSFSLKNLLPRFGFGTGIISIIIIVVALIVGVNFFVPFMKFLV